MRDTSLAAEARYYWGIVGRVRLNDRAGVHDPERDDLDVLLQYVSHPIMRRDVERLMQAPAEAARVVV